MLGAAQLVGHPHLRPRSIHSDDILQHFARDYYYLACVAFVKQVKRGAMAEHSPMLNDISGVARWEKVRGGMLKMYRGEVLEKRPIMQHFLFGSLLPWEWREQRGEGEEGGEREDTTGGEGLGKEGEGGIVKQDGEPIA